MRRRVAARANWTDEVGLDTLARCEDVLGIHLQKALGSEGEVYRRNRGLKRGRGRRRRVRQVGDESGS